MSFKAIDMSLAVHKNTEAAQIQRELNQKPLLDQAALAQSGLKTETENRQKAAKLEETDKSKIRDGRQGRSRDTRNGEEKEAAGNPDKPVPAKGAAEPVHPYKGHHIDLTL